MGTRKTESTKLCTPCLKVLLGILDRKERLKVFDRTLVVRKLIGRMLGVFCEFESGMFGNGAFTWLEDACDEVEEGRFAGTIGTENCDTGIHAGGFIVVRFFVER